jgi:hypothetical protein
MGFGAKINGGAYTVAEFQVAGDEVRVEMSQYDVLDLKAVIGCELEVALDVSLGIDDNRGASGFIADQVRSMGKAVQVKLVEDQGQSPLFGGGWRCRRLRPRALYGFRVLWDTALLARPASEGGPYGRRGRGLA